MRQVRDTLVWLAIILVVGGVIYVMPQVSDYVDAATGNERETACANCQVVGTHRHDVDRHDH